MEHTIFKTARQITQYAKTLETKTLQRTGKSLSFSGIERRLLDGAVIALHDGKLFELNPSKFEKNKEKVKQFLIENY